MLTIVACEAICLTLLPERSRLPESKKNTTSGSEGFGESETAAEGVTVGVLVSEDQDLLVGVDEVFDLVVLMTGRGLRGCYFLSSSGAGRTSFSSSEMCTLYSMDGSSSKRRSGEYLRFWSRRPSSWRMRPFAESRPFIEAFFSSGSPSTLTRTRADRRSGDM